MATATKTKKPISKRTAKNTKAKPAHRQPKPATKLDGHENGHTKRDIVPFVQNTGLFKQVLLSDRDIEFLKESMEAHLKSASMSRNILSMMVTATSLAEGATEEEVAIRTAQIEEVAAEQSGFARHILAALARA